MKLQTLTLAIVDDNAETRKIINRRLVQIFNAISIAVSIFTYDSASGYLSSLADHNYNLTFLDIEMPEIDGIELAGRLNDEDIKTHVIYVSNREDRVFDSLETNPLGFVRKSHFDQDIEKVIRHYIECLKKESESFFLLQNGKEQMTVKFDEIVFIETVKRKLCFHIDHMEKAFVTSMTLQSIEKEFLDNGFISSYKGILVNYRFIKVIRDDVIILKDETVIPLSRRKTNEAKSRYMELMQDKLISIY